MREFIKLGKKIYNLANPREKHRFVIFLGRALLHRKSLKELIAWFNDDDLRRRVLPANSFPIEQATRAFFYARSTFSERVTLIKEHIAFLQQNLLPEFFLHLSDVDGDEIEIWRNEYDGRIWHTVLTTEAGQRKEGMLSLEMNLGGEHLYQIMFWFARNKTGDIALWIGALQGPNMPNAKEIIKDITKYSHRYRTKNLVLYMLQAVARAFGVKHIYAVSNEGYYANNHIRRDRKLKTDFGEFWQEAGGHITADARFYELPLKEPRKTMEEIPARKRADYRKRFAFQDAIDEIIVANVRKIMQTKA